MELKAGDRVVAESESTERLPRDGVIEEVLGSGRATRYRIRWDDGHETIYTPAAGALHRVPGERAQELPAETTPKT